jgi:hypothetical protein
VIVDDGHASSSFFRFFPLLHVVTMRTLEGSKMK